MSENTQESKKIIHLPIRIEQPSSLEINIPSPEEKYLLKGLEFLLVSKMTTGEIPEFSPSIELISMINRNYKNAIKTGLENEDVMRATFDTPFLRMLFSEEVIESTIEFSMVDNIILLPLR